MEYKMKELSQNQIGKGIRELTSDEVEAVNGGGWLKFAFPVVVGFVWGGPAGALAVVAGIVATTGVSNIEHLYAHNEIPSINQIVK